MTSEDSSLAAVSPQLPAFGVQPSSAGTKARHLLWAVSGTTQSRNGIAVRSRAAMDHRPPLAYQWLH